MSAAENVFYSYAEGHGLKDIMEGLLQELLQTQPEDPISYLESAIKKKLRFKHGLLRADTVPSGKLQVDVGLKAQIALLERCSASMGSVLSRRDELESALAEMAVKDEESTSLPSPELSSELQAIEDFTAAFSTEIVEDRQYRRVIEELRQLSPEDWKAQLAPNSAQPEDMAALEEECLVLVAGVSVPGVTEREENPSCVSKFITKLEEATACRKQLKAKVAALAEEKEL